MGAEGAVKILFRRAPAASGGAAEAARERETRIQEYREEFLNPYLAAERGYIDDVIAPEETRARLVAGLRLLSSKREERPAKKHGNIPL